MTQNVLTLFCFRRMIMKSQHHSLKSEQATQPQQRYLMILLRVKRTMILLQTVEGQQLQRKKMNTDRKGEG